MMKLNFCAQMMRHLLWLIFVLSLLVFSLGVSWQLSKSANFFYDFWYQSLQIEATIKNNVVKNTHGKRDFPVETRRLHQAMFADIVRAIHQQGQGLRRISYQNSSGKTRRLLTNSEVVHLQDVANLLDKVSQLWLVNLLLLLFLVLLYSRKSVFNESDGYANNFRTSRVEGKSLIFEQVIRPVTTIPMGKHKLVAVALLLLLVVIVLSLWGFTSLFYYLHTVIFPADHQWFFYYKDSLMATIMKAPDIFSAIAAQLLAVALPLTAGIDAIFGRFKRRV